MLLAGATLIAVTGVPGCSLVSNAYKQVSKHEYLDEFLLAHRNKTFALKAWYRERHCYQNRQNLQEFKQGFLDGYMDVANGSNGCLPCVAPSQYWGWRYQSPGGKSAIDSWFAGYPMGVKAAEQDGVGHWSMLQPTPQYTPTSKPPAEPLPAPAEVIYGPDGHPVNIEGEVVIPGSARVIESPVTTSSQPPMRLEHSGELNAPAFNDSSFRQPQPAPGTDGLFPLDGDVMELQGDESATAVSQSLSDFDAVGTAETQAAGSSGIPFKFE